MSRNQSDERDDSDEIGLRVADERDGDPVLRAYQLARANCSDAEVAAALVVETQADPDEIRALVSEPVMAARLELERLAGRAALRDYVYRASMPIKPTAASLQQASWLSRQMLGYSTGGINDEVEEEARKLDGMTDAQLADYYEQKAAELRGKRKAGNE